MADQGCAASQWADDHKEKRLRLGKENSRCCLLQPFRWYCSPLSPVIEKLVMGVSSCSTMANSFREYIQEMNQKTISPWKRRLQRWRSESVGQRGPCSRETRDAHRAEAWSWIILLVLADDICIEVSPRKRRAICLIVLVMLLVSVSKYKNSDLKALSKKLADVAFKWYTPLGFWKWTNTQFDGVPFANWKGNNSQ